ncbi:MAG: IS630 family transposase, partial [Trichodesmium sp. St2_bin2_1]|nr:IS630 family transposase [Trichodesmium sp. St2_bin2_1]
KEKIVFFDKFVVYECPSIFYGWAEKNRRPKVPSKEKGRGNKLNGMIAIDGQDSSRVFPIKRKF